MGEISFNFLCARAIFYNPVCSHPTSFSLRVKNCFFISKHCPSMGPWLHLSPAHWLCPPPLGFISYPICSFCLCGFFFFFVIIYNCSSVFFSRCVLPCSPVATPTSSSPDPGPHECWPASPVFVTFPSTLLFTSPPLLTKNCSGRDCGWFFNW